MVCGAPHAQQGLIGRPRALLGPHHGAPATACRARDARTVVGERAATIARAAGGAQAIGRRFGDAVLGRERVVEVAETVCPAVVRACARRFRIDDAPRQTVARGERPHATHTILFAGRALLARLAEVRVAAPRTSPREQRDEADAEQTAEGPRGTRRGRTSAGSLAQGACLCAGPTLAGDSFADFATGVRGRAPAASAGRRVDGERARKEEDAAQAGQHRRRRPLEAARPSS